MSLDLQAFIARLGPVQRSRLAQMVDGAVLVRRHGAYALYLERDGKAHPAGGLIPEGDFAELVQAIPDLLPWQPGCEGYAYRLPAHCRGAYADLLQQTMPAIAEFVMESRAADCMEEPAHQVQVAP